MAHWEIISHPLWDCQWRPGGLSATCWRTIRVLPGRLSAIHWELLVLDASLSATHWRMSVASLGTVSQRETGSHPLEDCQWPRAGGVSVPFLGIVSHPLEDRQCFPAGMSASHWRTVSGPLKDCQPAAGGLSLAPGGFAATAAALSVAPWGLCQ